MCLLRKGWGYMCVRLYAIGLTGVKAERAVQKEWGTCVYVCICMQLGRLGEGRESGCAAWASSCE